MDHIANGTRGEEADVWLQFENSSLLRGRSVFVATLLAQTHWNDYSDVEIDVSQDFQNTQMSTNMDLVRVGRVEYEIGSASANDVIDDGDLTVVIVFVLGVSAVLLLTLWLRWKKGVHHNMKVREGAAMRKASLLNREYAPVEEDNSSIQSFELRSPALGTIQEGSTEGSSKGSSRTFSASAASLV